VILDGHIHIRKGEHDREEFVRRLKAAGVDGGNVISPPPASFGAVAEPRPAAERLDEVLWYCEAGPHLYPLYWVDPLEDDALDQVAMAVEAGVAGFKIICDRFPPGHQRALRVAEAVARAGRPLLFHSGILWDAKPSSMYNRPAGFEVLLEVANLRFCLAHISWPWCDELVAVYGKFLTSLRRRPELSCEMFVDITPGTPRIYRRDALTKLFTVGYEVKRNVIFGTDGGTSGYNVEGVQEWLERDGQIFEELGLDSETLEGVYAKNLLRFLGVSEEP